MPLPMFPLGTVLFPAVPLPLPVFEPRYRALARDCMAGAAEFGVVLIERGNEVGGGDIRTDLGTVARIVEATELPDGRWVLGTLGTRRIRVEHWLEDDPYPRADVIDVAEPPAGPGHPELLDVATARLRRALALAAELGEATAPATIELADDPVAAGYQACSLAPLGPLDRQRLLAVPAPEPRMELLTRLLDDAIVLLRARLGG